MRLLAGILIWMCGASLALGQEAVLELLQGRLKVQQGGQVRFLVKKDPATPVRVNLAKGIRVQTGANSQAVVNLRGGEEVVQLRSNSLFSLDGVEQQETKIRMPVGKAQFKIDPNRAVKRRFQVRTTTAIVGVKGTEFVMGAGDGQTSMLTLSGTVEMASVEAPKVQVEVNAGEASKLEVGSAPTEPVAVPPEMQSTIAESDSSDSFEEVSFPPAQSIEEAAAQAEEEEAATEEGSTEEGSTEEESSTEQESATEEPAPEEAPVETPQTEELDLNLDEIIEQVQDAVDSANETERLIQLQIQRADKL